VDPRDIVDMQSFARDFLSEHRVELAQLSNEFLRSATEIQARNQLR
jgi:hypothetical protein